MYRGPAALFVVPDCHKISRLPTPCCASPATLLTSEKKNVKVKKRLFSMSDKHKQGQLETNQEKKGQQEAVGIV